MDPASLVAFAKSVRSITEFVAGNGLHDAISTIVGDIHVDAAKLALETARISVKPQDRLNSVITHLEAAHAAYARVHNQAVNFTKKSTDWQPIRNACAKDVWVCAVMALCYASLGERRAMLNSLALGEKAFESRRKEAHLSEGASVIAIPFAVLGLLNPRNWSIQDELITAEQFAAFRTAIQGAV